MIRAADYFAALADVFGLTLDVTPAKRETLWRRLAAGHEQWVSRSS